MPLVGILVYILIDAAVYALRPFSTQNIEWFSLLMITGANAIAALALYCLRSARDDSSIWSWLVRGIGLAMLAHVSAIVISLLFKRPFAWRVLDDVLMLIADGCIIFGLWRWVQTTLSDPSTPSDTGQSSATVASVFMFFFTAIGVIIPAFGMWGDPTDQRVIDLLLSLFDILGFVFCIRIVLFHLTQRINFFSTPIYIFSIGYGTLCLADPFFHFQILLGVDLSRHWINVILVLGYLLISNAAWVKRRQ